MDDLPDKLRRNVVVLSAAIVAITVFHLSFKPTGTLLGFAQVGNVTPFRVWLALTLVLVYMFQRYWFHPDTRRDLADSRCELEGFVRDLAQRAAAREVARHIAGRSSWFGLLHPASLAQFGEPKFRKAHRVGSTVRVKTSALAQESNGRIPRLPWQAPVTVSVQHVYVSSENPGQHSQGAVVSGGCALRASRVHRSAIWGIACVRVLLAKGGVDVAVPIGLAALAFGLCLFQLVLAGVKP